MGEYVNKYVTLDNRGLLPSISRLMNFGRAPRQTRKQLEETQLSVESFTNVNLSTDKGNFKRFWKFMADGETFLVPIDHEKFEQNVLNKELLQDIINGRLNRVMNYDFSTEEIIMQHMQKKMDEAYKEIAQSQGEMHITEEDQKIRAYSYYKPNREFSNEFESAKLKKVDDGTFINNGYR